MSAKYEIINHGMENCQYFHGYGTYFSDFEKVVIGVGVDAVEAYNDAVEQIYMVEDDAEKLKLPKRPRGIGINKKNKVPGKFQEDTYWYVIIRY